MDHFEAQAARDGLVEASGALKVVAVSLTKIANDLRLMGSGPRAGLAEIFLPELQQGSSIMPGKVNPVMPEILMQVAAQVIGNDTTITVGGMGGHFELNVLIPLMARNRLDSIELLASASRLLAENCVDGIEANRDRNQQFADSTPSAATALNPLIGYDKAPEIVKEATASGRSLREAAREAGVDEAILDEALDFQRWRSRTSARRRRRSRGFSQGGFQVTVRAGTSIGACHLGEKGGKRMLRSLTVAAAAAAVLSRRRLGNHSSPADQDDAARQRAGVGEARELLRVRPIRPPPVGFRVYLGWNSGAEALRQGRLDSVERVLWQVHLGERVPPSLRTIRAEGQRCSLVAQGAGLLDRLHADEQSLRCCRRSPSAQARGRIRHDVRRLLGSRTDGSFALR